MWHCASRRALSEAMDALGYGFTGPRPRPPALGPLPGTGGGGAAAYMDLDWSFAHPANYPAPYYSHGSSCWNTGAATHAAAGHPSPYGFGLDHHTFPPPAGSCLFYGGDTAPIMSPVTRQLHDVALYLRYGGPFPGGVGVSAVPDPVQANPFSFGLDLPPPPTLLAGYGPFAQPPRFEASVPLRTVAPEPAGDHDIDAILRAREQRAGERPSPDYLNTTQGGRMVPDARASLVRWMSWVARHFGLVPGTLHHAVSYFDRFLSARRLPDVAHDRLRLLGATALYVAAKYEDQGAAWEGGMSARELAHRCGDSTTARDVLDAERVLLAALDHRLGGPTAFTFVEHFTEHYGEDDAEAQEVRREAHRFTELALRDYGCLRLAPSAVAAAAIFLARLVLLKPSYGQVMRWNRELMERTGYKPRDLEYAVEAICSLMHNVQRGRGGRFDVVIFPVFFADPSLPR